MTGMIKTNRRKEMSYGMGEEILSVKLKELDEKMGTFHSKLQECETAGHILIRAEINNMEKVCAENEQNLYDEMRFSKSKVPQHFAQAYDQIMQVIQSTVSEINNWTDEDEELEEETVEELLLLAEYGIDFAMESVNRAFMMSLYAMDAQMMQQKSKED